MRKYTTPDGLTVLCGRNAAENDDLSHGADHAHADDVWLHAHGVSGAHVVLKVGADGRTPSASDVAFAADVAAWHSQARDKKCVPVTIARVAHIVKGRAKGEARIAPGAVPHMVHGWPSRLLATSRLPDTRL